MWWLVACVGTKTESDIDSAVVVEDTEEPTIDDLSWVNPANLPTAPNACREPVRVFAQRVVDGDTFIAKHIDDSGEERIRMIGIDTPEISSGDCYAQEAKSFLNSLIYGKYVWLTFDETCYDVYDRTLAYVHIGVQEADFVERQILWEGYAPAFPWNDTPAFIDLFDADEAMAIANGAGGWSACGW
jgi:endonuclease YncB( thermonuclease family)